MRPNRPLNVQPDQLVAWLSATAAGDRRAFQLLYRATAPKLFALLLRILKSREVAEDALQDVYVKIWERAGSYQAERGAPMAWLLTVARYQALDVLRHARPEAAVLEDGDRVLERTLTADGPGPEQHQETRQALGAVQRCLAQLPAEQRDCLLRAYLDGATRQEIADTLDVPIGTVKTWLRRGLIRLRELLTERTP